MITPSPGRRTARETEHEICRLATSTTLGHRKIAAQIGVGECTVRRVLRRHSIGRENISIRNALVEEHRWLAERCARSVGRGLPPHLRQDLFGEAAVALVESASSFDPGRGIAFPLYAQQRIRGACLDSVRRRHWTNGTAGELSREDSEVRAEGAPNVEDRLIDEAELSSKRKMVRAAIQNLPGRLAVLLWMIYVEGRSIATIAPTFDVGAARLSQMHREGVAMVREFIPR